MDKSDVDREDDAEKHPLEGLDNLKQLPSDHLMSAELERNSKNAAVDSVLAEQINPNIQLLEQNNAKFQVDEPISYLKGKEDDQNCPTCEVQDQNKAMGMSKEPDKATCQSEELNKATDEAEEQNTAEGEKEEQPTLKSEMEDQTHMESAAKEQDFCASSKDVEDAVASMLEDQKACENAEAAKNHSQNGQLPFQLPVTEVPPKKKEVVDEVPQSESEEMVKGVVEDVHHSETEGHVNGRKEPKNKSVLPAAAYVDNVKLGGRTVIKVTKQEVGDAPLGNKHQPATPDFPIKYSSKRSGSHSGEALKNVYNDAQMLEGDDGTPEEQGAFIKELESFYRERGLEFKPPKFYGQPLNCCKLWRSVIRLGGYDLVTGSKLWRQVGESFRPPKTCTTVSWTFRIFYEKSLLEYERYKIQTGELQLPVASVPEPANVDNEGNDYQASGSGRARRDAAARAMQGWHVQRHFGYGEVGEPIIKDKSLNNMHKRENKLKSIGSLKQKRPSEIELPVKAQRTETYRQLVRTVVDVGPPADWVKINVRETKDCFEVYALVPGLLREEVRVQSDPAGRLVITGQPEKPDNPWGITAFKKVVSLPARIDPLQTSAVVSLHGRLFVRVPFEQANI